MRNKILFLLFILSILAMLSVFVSASDDATVAPLKFGTCVQLTQTCINCTSVNITTIKFSDETIQVINSPMSQNGFGYYNYSFCSTNILGDFSYSTIGDPDGFLDGQTINTQITTNGQIPTIATAIFYIGLFFVLMVILVLMMWAHMGDRSPVWKFWWFSFIWLWMIAVTFVAYRTSQDFFTTAEFIQSFFYFLWQILMYAFPFYLMVCVGYSGYWVYQQKQIQDLMHRGLNLEQATNRARNGRGRGGNYG